MKGGWDTGPLAPTSLHFAPRFRRKGGGGSGSGASSRSVKNASVEEGFSRSFAELELIYEVLGLSGVRPVPAYAHDRARAGLLDECVSVCREKHLAHAALPKLRVLSAIQVGCIL
eukprot:CAMPEP_0119469662 /NCGR_PEP_ID=MMETSP1344-20130328/2888_1 /TAXON_ID=236787 /ORGANISM="Florenciella parvula, Strain CCMP2471" /LENGTH=114 /DNA_ID=CAMNT_0007502243 /DNA_START=389 /DNA_END=733 /DNA_ORIENTATION=+